MAYDKVMLSLLNKNEVRRLEKAARDKNKNKLAEWAGQFEARLMEQFTQVYEEEYRKEVQSTIDNFLIAIAYTLHFSEEFSLDNEHLPDFMNDLMVTVDMYRTGESTPTQYLEELKENGVFFDKFDYSKVYRDRTDYLDKLIKEYESKLANMNINTSNSSDNKK